MKILAAILIVAVSACDAGERKLAAVIIDGVNNHDWVAATNGIRAILESSGRFTVDVSTYPNLPEFSKYDVVIDNFNGGHTEKGLRWPEKSERAFERYLSGGGGVVIFHAANNAFLQWREFNRIIGLGWRAPSFAEGIAIDHDRIRKIPIGQGLPPGHGPRHDFDVFVLRHDHPITRGLPDHWRHPSEQLTHGQHGPAEGLTVLTYAFSEVSHQGEPMDWIREYGKGRVYTTMLGHTWKNELNPNLDDPYFQALFARGVEWAASGRVTLPVDLGWKALFNGRDLAGWEIRGDGSWTVMPDGVLAGHRDRPKPLAPFGIWPADQKAYRDWFNQHSWLYTRAEFGEFDLHLEYWIPHGSNSGVSIRDKSRAHHAIGEPDSDPPELMVYPKTTPAHIGYEIQIADDERDTFLSGSIYGLVHARAGLQRDGQWNSLDIESRSDSIRVRVNGQHAAESPGDASRPKTGPIGLQLHDQFTLVMFRNIRIRQVTPGR